MLATAETKWTTNPRDVPFSRVSTSYPVNDPYKCRTLSVPVGFFLRHLCPKGNRDAKTCQEFHLRTESFALNETFLHTRARNWLTKCHKVGSTMFDSLPFSFYWCCFFRTWIRIIFAAFLSVACWRHQQEMESGRWKSYLHKQHIPYQDCSGSSCGGNDKSSQHHWVCMDGRSSVIYLQYEQCTISQWWYFLLLELG